VVNGENNPHLFFDDYLFENEKNMKLNISHPSFVAFLENVTDTISSSVNIENYFSLPQDKKMNVLYVVFKLLKNSLKARAKLSDEEVRYFVDELMKNNERSENYEFSAILKDISNNFDSINEVTKPVKRQTRTIKAGPKE
jgi:polyhydroxyalkanoate synthesis regulator phasin